MTITTTDIMDTEALLRERLNGLRETFQREEDERVAQRDRIRDVASENAEDHGKQDGVDEILLAMGLPRMELYVSVHVLVRWQQVIHSPDMYRLRITQRGEPSEHTDWRPGFDNTGHAIGSPTLSWVTLHPYSLLIEDLTVHRGQDCYCEHIAQVVADPTDLAAQYTAPPVPDGCRIVSQEFIGCSGEDCTRRQQAMDAVYAGR